MTINSEDIDKMVEDFTNLVKHWASKLNATIPVGAGQVAPAQTVTAQATDSAPVATDSQDNATTNTETNVPPYPYAPENPSAEVPPPSGATVDLATTDIATKHANPSGGSEPTATSADVTALANTVAQLQAELARLQGGAQ